MKLIPSMVIALLLSQVFAEALLLSETESSFASINEESHVVDLQQKHHSHKINCKHACTRRCKESSRKKVCHRACNSCCKKCHCVPPGTYGNKEACPCYASLKTHGNRPKCP